jgi:hypothetical protein
MMAKGYKKPKKGRNSMKKEYEKPVVEIIEFEYDIQAEGSAEGNIDVGGWWT